MVPTSGRHALLALFPAALALLLWAEPARAQGRCAQQRGASRQAGAQRLNALQPQSPALQAGLQGRVPPQQVGLQAQAPAQQDPTLVALQQNALATAQQQNAQLVALQQQNAQLMAQQQRLLQQNALLAAQQQRMQQQNALLVGQQPPPPQPDDPGAQPRPAADGGKPAAKAADPEATAARKLTLARDLLADASRAEFEGETDRAARMRTRAAERLRDLVGQYPDTRAADKAQGLLAKLGL
jgi:hypothetical protein